MLRLPSRLSERKLVQWVLAYPRSIHDSVTVPGSCRLRQDLRVLQR
jgi:hypothetical protein